MHNKSIEKFSDLGPATFLVNVRNEHEANIVESILTANDIPSLRKHKDVGSYLSIQMGMSDYGIDILVPEKLVQNGKELIEIEAQIPVLDDAREEDDYSDDFSRRRRKRAIILIAWVWGLPLISWLISKLLSNWR